MLVAEWQFRSINIHAWGRFSLFAAQNAGRSRQMFSIVNDAFNLLLDRFANFVCSKVITNGETSRAIVRVVEAL